jgi:Anti-sigma factor NepR
MQDESLRRAPGVRLRLAIVRRESEVAFLKSFPEPRMRPEGHVAEIIPLVPRKTRPAAKLHKDQPKLPLEDHIGQQLKAVYDDVLSQPIPERFVELLTQLSEPVSKEEDAQ